MKVVAIEIITKIEQQLFRTINIWINGFYLIFKSNVSVDKHMQHAPRACFIIGCI